MGRACRRGKGLVDAQVQQSQSYHEALCRFNLLHYILPSILSLDCLFCISSRSYGKIRELTATVPNKMPKVCSSEEVVESIKSGDHVIR